MSVDSATDEAIRAEVDKRPQIIRRRRALQTCVIEA
jgi:hypothetical protein